MSPRLVIATLVMCMALIHASAFMHLTNAGMGQPDWPASYGLIATGGTAGVAGTGHTAAAAIAPVGIADRIHRLVANVLQLLIVAVAFSAFRHRKDSMRRPLALPLLALAISLVLAFLGAWFGSPLRYPWIMMVNLAGGFALLAMFWWLTLNLRQMAAPAETTHRLRPWALAGLAVIGVQVLLGGWVDAYYAALACTQLPGCAGVDWSWSDLPRGIGLLDRLHVDAGGRVVTDTAVAAAVHMAHRIWSVVTLLYLGWLAWRAYGIGGRGRLTGLIMLVMLFAQAGLGLAMIAFSLPLAFVMAHTVVAALLVLSVLTLMHLALSHACP